MPLTIEILPGAQKQIAKIHRQERFRIKRAILGLAENPRPPGVKKLSDRVAWRIRIGDYRVVYEICDQKLVVSVVRVGHRRDIYK